jgi:hypothetical protein
MFVDIEQYREVLNKALELSGTYSFDDVRRGVETGEFQLWAGNKSAVLTQIHDYPQKRVLYVFAAGGTMDEMKLLWPLVRDWATRQGCKSAFLVGRRGWARSFLRAAGWKPSALVMMETTL